MTLPFPTMPTPRSSRTPVADHAAAASAPVTRALLEDGALALRVAAEAWPAVAAWVPRLPARAPAPGEARAWIEVEAGPPVFEVPVEPPTLHMRVAEGWLRPSGQLLVCEPRRRVSAVADPAALRATVRVDAPGDTAGLGVEIFEGLTLSAALLLGRLGRTLVHGAAVVPPGGGAWLLAGGSFSGKSTTCITLIRGGWDYLADDHVVLEPAPGGGVRVEGWPRKFNLDHGYQAGASQGVRGRVDPALFGPGRWRPAAPLAGLLFPRVDAGLPTALEPVAPADALSRLLGQSPWLLADAGAAPAVLALLERAARTPAWELRLGRDCYRDPDALQHVLLQRIGTMNGAMQAPKEGNPTGNA